MSYLGKVQMSYLGALRFMLARFTRLGNTGLITMSMRELDRLKIIDSAAHQSPDTFGQLLEPIEY
jgi:hypothetical protein